MESRTRTIFWPIVTILVGVFLVVTSLPTEWKKWAPDFMQPTLHLGLDLQGGTQLDFRISESEMENQIQNLEAEIAELEQVQAAGEDIDDKRVQIANIRFLQHNVIESIRTVLERRINSMGVSEAIITPSYYGDEKHLLVECPGVVDIQQCIATVGKTILLEFKEQAGKEDEEHIANMKQLSENAFKRITASGEMLATLGEDLGPTLGVYYNEDAMFFESEIPEELADLWNTKAGDPVVFRDITLDAVQQGDDLIVNRGIMLAEVAGEKVEEERVFADPVEALEFLSESRDDMTLKKHTAEDPSGVDKGYLIALNPPSDTEDEEDEDSELPPELEELTKGLRPGTMVKAESSTGKLGVVFVTKYQEEQEEIEASHILIAYEGAVRADESITRSQTSAREEARELKVKLDEGANFATLARENSDGPSGKDGGSLGKFGRGQMTADFEEAAFALSLGEISNVVETEFGYHIIKLDKEPSVTQGSIDYLELVADTEEAQEEAFNGLQSRSISQIEEQLPIRTLFFSFIPTGWKDTTLDGKHFRRATVTTDPLTGIPVVQIVFDTEGGKIFQELTKKNIGNPIAIFVGGELISAPTVQSEIPGGIAIITGSQDFDEANKLAQDLNTGAIPAPIHLVGQVTVEATLGAAALRQSLNAALLGFLFVGIYMIFYYRVLGVVAALALIIYAIIFTALLKLPLFLLTDQYVVLTLAGIAGIILSIGMAVDANVLIFERMKEELRKGKLLQTAADTGFKRAWSSIRDSNVSTLITAGILFIIGTSIVRGFAVTLSLGILISLFTAIFVTRFIIRVLYKSPIANNIEAFGVRKEK
jgi:protein-export membrane protein SecD